MEAPERGTLSGVYIDLPMPRDTQHPCEGSGQVWAKHVDQTFLSRLPFPGFFDHFVIAWGIKPTNIICQIINFQGTCDPCCYCVLLLRCPCMGVLSLARKLLGAYMEREGTLAPAACSGTRQNSSSRNISQARGHSLGCLPQGPES